MIPKYDNNSIRTRNIINVDGEEVQRQYLMKTVDTISNNFVQLYPPKEPGNFSLTMVKKIVKNKLPHLTTPTKRLVNKILYSF